MPVFEIDNEIVLRRYEENDAPALLDIVKSNYDHLRTFLQWVAPDYSIDTARDFIEQNEIGAAEKKREGFGIFYRGKLAGSIGFVKLDWGSRYAEIGYWIAKNYEGKGLVIKSAKVLIHHVFNDLGMNRVEIRCATENVRSRAIPERLGFQLEGVLRQSIWRHDRFYDVAVYGLLAVEWDEKNKNQKGEIKA